MDFDTPYDFTNIPEISSPPPKSNKTILIIIIICLFILSVAGCIAGYYMYTKSKTSDSPTPSTPNPTPNSNVASKTTTASAISANIQPQSNKPMPVLPIKIPTSNEKRTNVDIICTVNINDFTNFTCKDPKTDESADYVPDNMPEYPTYSSTNHLINIINGKVFKLSFSEEINSSGNKILDYYVLVPYSFIVDFVIDLSLGDIKINSLQDLLNIFDKIDNDFDKLTVITDKCLKLKPGIRSESKPPYNTTCIFFPGLSKIGALADTIEKILLPYIPENVQTQYFNIIDNKIKDSPTPTLTVIEYVIFLSMFNRLKKKKINYVSQCKSSDSLNTKIQISC
jgi:hypothetical protein